MNKREVIKYLKENELNIQSAHATVIALDLVYHGYIDSDKVHGVKYSPIFSHVYFGSSKPFHQIIPQKIISELSRKIYLDYSKNKKSLDNKIKRHQGLEVKINKLWKRRIKMNSLKFYKEFIKISREWWRYGSIGEDKAEVINQEITPRFAKRHNLSIEKARELISILSFPKVQSVFNLERKNFLKICLNPNKNKMETYIKKYFWFKTDFCKAIKITSPIVLKEARSEIKKRGRKSISEELTEIDERFQKILSQKKKILAELKITKQDKKDIYFAEQNTYWFDQRKRGMTIQLYYLFSFLKDMAKEYKINYNELVGSTVEEVTFLLKDGKRLGKTEKEKRQKGIFFIHEKNKKAIIFYNKDAQEMLNTALSFEKKELKGMVASTGGLDKIKGKVRIILNPDKETFNRGDILVTSMTRIEFVPLMRRAKAIITNEGGIACHAAIISRELGIPAIIGTKQATRMLKTGDIVELNLKTGIIKK